MREAQSHGMGTGDTKTSSCELGHVLSYMSVSLPVKWVRTASIF